VREKERFRKGVETAKERDTVEREWKKERERGMGTERVLQN